MIATYTRPSLAIAKLGPIAALTAERGQRLDWDSPVVTEKLILADGTDSGLLGVVMTDRRGIKNVVGTYGRESLLPNVELVGRFEDACAKLGLSFTRKVNCLGDGARFSADYEFAGLDGEIIHSPVTTVIRLRNSYDGSCHIVAELMAKVLVCLNGMEGFGSVAKLQKRHSPKLDLGFLVHKLEELLGSRDESFSNMAKLSEIKLSAEQVSNLYGNFVQYGKNRISANTASRMLEAYHMPDVNESNLEHTVWRAYMAGTRVLRDLREVKPTVAMAAGNIMGGMVALMAKNVHNERQMLATPKKSLLQEIQLTSVVLSPVEVVDENEDLETLVVIGR